MHIILKRYRGSREISVRKGQGWKLLFNVCELYGFGRRCMRNNHDTATWAQRYLGKPLSLNTVRKAIWGCIMQGENRASNKNIRFTGPELISVEAHSVERWVLVSASCLGWKWATGWNTNTSIFSGLRLHQGCFPSVRYYTRWASKNTHAAIKQQRFPGS